MIIFLSVLLAIRKKVSLGNALFFGAIALGLIFGLDFTGMLRSILHSVTHPKTLSLTIMVCLILVFSHSMEMAGQMQRLLERYQGLISRPKINLIVFPALIGLLPMPGGAIFSAPMVKTLGDRFQLTPAQLSFINYWFRHIWEYWWPLYPGVLLTTALASLNLWVFVAFLFPLTCVALAVGYLPLKILGKNSPLDSNCVTPSTPITALQQKSIGRQKPAQVANVGLVPRTSRTKPNPLPKAIETPSCHKNTPPPRPPFLPFLKELLPILIVIILGLAGGALLSVLLKSYKINITKELGLIFSLLVAIGWVWHKNRLSSTQRRRILLQKQLLNMFYMVIAILVFKGMLEDSQAVQMISQELLHWHIPLISICIILPFIVGGVVGITIAFVGTTFPILISLIQALGESQFMLPYMMLALVSGFVGVLLSPLHLCLLLSNEYFKATLAPVYRYLWLPCIFLLITAYIYFFALHAIVFS